MKQALCNLHEVRLERLVNKKKVLSYRNDIEMQIAERRLLLNEQRKLDVVKANAHLKITRSEDKTKNLKDLFYTCFYRLLNKQQEFFYLEERIEHRRARFYQGELIEDVPVVIEEIEHQEEANMTIESRPNLAYIYDRMAAVQYAERWWNSENPKYKNFKNNCTNFVSQCLHAGGAPMWGHPSRSLGWWMKQNNWSYSWSVANAMKSYLDYSKVGLRAEKVDTPDKLMPGDLIGYDFQGDGRYDHITFVVAKDLENMPLVNAQNENSRMRYWSYEDSTAYTPKIKYTFFRIVDDTSF